jgi:hypothetical protein
LSVLVFFKSNFTCAQLQRADLYRPFLEAIYTALQQPDDTKPVDAMAKLSEQTWISMAKAMKAVSIAQEDYALPLIGLCSATAVPTMLLHMSMASHFIPRKYLQGIKLELESPLGLFFALNSLPDDPQVVLSSNFFNLSL